MINALSDCFSGSRNSDRPLCRIGQHLRGDLNRRPRHFPNFFDFGASFPDQRSTLACRYDESQRYRRPGHSATSTIYVLELGTPLRDPITTQHHINKCTIHTIQITATPTTTYRLFLHTYISLCDTFGSGSLGSHNLRTQDHRLCRRRHDRGRARKPPQPAKSLLALGVFVIGNWVCDVYC